MIVVSDTTPLNYLVLINEAQVLPRLFGEVYTSRSVLTELLHARTPELVRQWASSPPAWLNVHQPRSNLSTTERLGRGEADAISLAKEMNAAAILLDEKRATAIAKREGLTVVRTLALLELSAQADLIDLKDSIRKLTATTFRISPAYLEQILRRNAKK